MRSALVVGVAVGERVAAGAVCGARNNSVNLLLLRTALGFSGKGRPVQDVNLERIKPSNFSKNAVPESSVNIVNTDWILDLNLDIGLKFVEFEFRI